MAFNLSCRYWAEKMNAKCKQDDSVVPLKDCPLHHTTQLNVVQKGSHGDNCFHRFVFHSIVLPFVSIVSIFPIMLVNHHFSSGSPAIATDRLTRAPPFCLYRARNVVSLGSHNRGFSSKILVLLVLPTFIVFQPLLNYLQMPLCVLFWLLIPF